MDTILLRYLSLRGSATIRKNSYDRLTIVTTLGVPYLPDASLKQHRVVHDKAPLCCDDDLKKFLSFF
jgi:hypothetical protein